MNVYLYIAVITRRPHPNPRVVNVIMVLLLNHLREGYIHPAIQSFFKKDNVALDWMATDV